MKKSIVTLSLAAFSLIGLTACNGNGQQNTDTLAEDTLMAVECETIDTTLVVVEDTVAAPAPAPAQKKATAQKKVEEKAQSVQVKTLSPTGKPNAKTQATELKQGEGNSVESKQLTPNRPDPRKAKNLTKANN